MCRKNLSRSPQLTSEVNNALGEIFDHRTFLSLRNKIKWTSLRNNLSRGKSLGVSEGFFNRNILVALLIPAHEVPVSPALGMSANSLILRLCVLTLPCSLITPTPSPGAILSGTLKRRNEVLHLTY